MGIPEMNYYGVGSRDWYAYKTEGGTQTMLGLVGKLTEKELYHYYWTEMIPYPYTPEAPIPSTSGKPFDVSVKLWDLDPKASFACNGYVYCPPGTLFNYECHSATNPKPVPLIMMARNVEQATPVGGLFTSNPKERYADGAWNSGGSTGCARESSLIYDIVYNTFCLSPNVNIYRKTDNNYVSRTLDGVASYIDGDPDNRDVSFLRPDMYYGTKSERIITACATPADVEGETTYGCQPIADIYAYKPLPNDDNLRNYIKGSGTWENDKVFSPFLTKYRDYGLWFQLYDNDYFAPIDQAATTQYMIGFNRSLTRNAWRDGAQTIDGTSNKITGEFVRINYDRKIFDDVSYHWEARAYVPSLKYDLKPGDDISLLGNVPIRVMSILVIDDYKGNTKGKASELAVKHEIAYIGFYFSDSVTTASSGVLGTSGSGTGVYLPKRVNGIPNGEYYTGDEIKDIPYADAESTQEFINESSSSLDDFSPDLSNLAFADMMASGRVYCFLDSFEKLLDNIATIPALVDQGYSSQYYFFGADPYDYILGYYKVPAMFLPANFLDSIDMTSRTKIQLGKWDTYMAQVSQTEQASGVPIGMRVPIRRVFIPSTYIPRKFNNFLDYEPYTNMSLFLPYYGTIELPPSLFVGNSILVDSLLDLLSGRVTYLIYCNSIQYTSVSCNCRIEIPITGEDISSYVETVIRGKQEIATNKTQAETRIATLASHAAISGGISYFKGNSVGGLAALGSFAYMNHIINKATEQQNEFIESNLQRTQPVPQTISLGSGTEGLGNILQPFITFNYPILLDDFDERKYGKINGFACYKNDSLSNYHGFTIMENPILDNLDISAEEKEMIRKLLAEGVILPYE